MRRTAGRLPDGREIVYFDERDDAVRVGDGPPGHASASAGSSEIRYDPLLDEWVVIAGHRQNRTFLPPTDRCPLCPSRPGLTTEIPAAGYDVVVFENRFPAFAGPTDEVPGPGSALVPRMPGLGRCEVICFTSDHELSFAQLTPARARLIVDVWVDRTLELSRLPYVEQVFCFENRGEEIGVTLHHPHGQIYGYPFVAPRTRRQLESARHHRERTCRDLFADVVAEERAAGVRIIAESAHWTAFVPAAARWPVEVHLYPRRPVPDLPALRDEERDDFADIYLDLLWRLDALYGVPLPYMACWYQAPVRADRDLARLHMQVISPKRTATKLKYLAGSEAAMGVFLNDVFPEDTATRLRELRPEIATREVPRAGRDSRRASRELPRRESRADGARVGVGC